MRRGRIRSREKLPETSDAMHRPASGRWRRPFWFLVSASFLFSSYLFFYLYRYSVFVNNKGVPSQEAIGNELANSIVDHHQTERDDDNAPSVTVLVTEGMVDKLTVGNSGTANDTTRKPEDNGMGDSGKGEEKESEVAGKLADSDENHNETRPVKKKGSDGDGSVPAEDKNIGADKLLAGEGSVQAGEKEKKIETVGEENRKVGAGIRGNTEFDGAVKRVAGDIPVEDERTSANRGATKTEAGKRVAVVQEAETRAQTFDVLKRVAGVHNKKKGSSSNAEEAQIFEAVANQLPVAENQKQGSVGDTRTRKNAEDVEKFDVVKRVAEKLPVGSENRKEYSRDLRIRSSEGTAENVETVLPVSDEIKKQSSVREEGTGKNEVKTNDDAKVNEKLPSVDAATREDTKQILKNGKIVPQKLPRVDENQKKQGSVRVREEARIREKAEQEKKIGPVADKTAKSAAKTAEKHRNVPKVELVLENKLNLTNKAPKKKHEPAAARREAPKDRAATVISKQPPTKTNDSCTGKYIYIHQLPDRFNQDMLSNCRSLSKWFDMCPYTANFGLGPRLNNALKQFSNGGWFETNQFTLEVIFHHRMKQYKCLTKDSSKATAIYLPYYAGLDVSRYLWYDRSLKDSAALDLTRWLRDQPEWKRMWGRDHFFVAGRITWDFRREGNNMRNWGNKLMFLPESKNMTILTIESSPWHRNDFGIPYPTYFHPKSDLEVREWQRKVRKAKRKHLFSFAGAPRPNLKSSIRGEIINQCKAARRKCRLLECTIGNKCYQPVNVMKMFESSVFCLQPSGDSFTRRSTFDSILAGCIPVFFHPGSAYVQYIWHFPKNYNKYSVWIPGKDVKDGKVNIERVLQDIPKRRVVAMREQLIRLIPKIVYADPGFGLKTHEDAFDIAVKGVLERIERSRKDMEEGKNSSFGFNEEKAWKFYTYGTQRKHEWDGLFDRSHGNVFIT